MRKFFILFFISITNIAIFANTNKEQTTEPLSFVFPSKYDLQTTTKKLQAAVKAANYRTYPPRKLLEDLTFKEASSNQIVIRFCNFDKMQYFLNLETRLGIVLPCRMTVVENDKQQVSVVIENYKRTVKRFNNKKMFESANVLIDELSDVIEEALW
jgi:cytochrome c oxidase cbb3-type subunit 3